MYLAFVYTAGPVTILLEGKDYNRFDFGTLAPTFEAPDGAIPPVGGWPMSPVVRYHAPPTLDRVSHVLLKLLVSRQGIRVQDLDERGDGHGVQVGQRDRGHPQAVAQGGGRDDGIDGGAHGTSGIPHPGPAGRGRTAG